MKKRLFGITLLSIILSMGLQLAVVIAVKAQSVTIKIDEIVQDQYIKGKVSNLANPGNYKVLVYVLTDKWYIHPYANQDEGKSWAAIDANSNWSIPTEKREFIARGIAVLIVDRAVAEDAPSNLNKINQVKNHAVMIYSKEEMKQNGWYGKL